MCDIVEIPDTTERLKQRQSFLLLVTVTKIYKTPVNSGINYCDEFG